MSLLNLVPCNSILFEKPSNLSAIASASIPVAEPFQFKKTFVFGCYCVFIFSTLTHDTVSVSDSNNNNFLGVITYYCYLV